RPSLPPRDPGRRVPAVPGTDDRPGGGAGTGAPELCLFGMLAGENLARLGSPEGGVFSSLTDPPPLQYGSPSASCSDRRRPPTGPTRRAGPPLLDRPARR